MDINRIALGKNIREKRKAMGLTLEKLSEKCNISINFLGNIERGADIPSLKSLLKICNALNVSSDYLLKDSLTYNKSLEGKDNFHVKINNEIMKMSLQQQEKVYIMLKILEEFNS